jgi:signal transduction histidine kinase
MQIIGTKNSVVRRILIPLLALIFVSNIALVAIIMGQLDKQLLLVAEQNLKSESRVQEVQFRANIAELTRDLRFVVLTPPMTGVIRSAANSGIDPVDGSTDEMWLNRLAGIFSGLLNANSQNVQLRLIRATGHEMLRVDRSGLNNTIRVVPEVELQDKSESQYFIDAAAMAAGHIYLSDIELNREFGQIAMPLLPVIRAATPLYMPDGSLFGIVVINQSLQSSFNELQNIVEDRHDFYVANGKGEYLLHPNPSRSFRFEYGESSKIQHDFPVAEKLLNNPLSTVLNGIDQFGNRKRVFSLRTISYNPDDVSDRIIIASSSGYQKALAIKERLFNKIYLVLIFAALIALLLAVYVSRRIAAPIVAMDKALKFRGLQATSEDLPIDDGSEIGDLAKSFDKLLGELSRRQAMLEREIKGRKVAQQDLQFNNQKLATINQEMQQFAYIASHDLQEPLRTVRSFVDLFEENYSSQLDERAHTFMAFMQESTGRMSELVYGLLDYSRLATETLVTEVNCQELVTMVCDDLALQISDAGASIRYADLPVIHGRNTELRLLFQNLISNALKFSRPGIPPEVVISVQKLDDSWEFRVQDNGIGISAEHFQRVFLIFQRLHDRDAYSGTGIGLAHCKKIVELHDGSIWLESTLGEGSIFIFTLRDIEK